MFVKNFDHLMELAKKSKKNRIAVVCADNFETLEPVYEAEKLEIADFILIGDKAKIDKVCKSNKLKLRAEIVDEKERSNAAILSVDMINKGKAVGLMKGNIHSSEFLRAIISSKKIVPEGRRVTQISVIQKKNKDGFLMMTDCAITVNPDLNEKKIILENAVDLQHKLGCDNPRVAILSAVEVINPSMPDTLDAAALCKMRDRGQIKGCVVDGPFAMDNILSSEAAKTKGIKSEVSGNADIILFPNLITANATSKVFSIFYEEKMLAATVGPEIPIVFTSRTETVEGKLLSIALCSYLASNK